MRWSAVTSAESSGLYKGGYQVTERVRAGASQGGGGARRGATRDEDNAARCPPGRRSGGLFAGGAGAGAARDDGGVDVLEHDRAGDDDPFHVLAAGHLVHHREQDFLQDGPQAAGAGAAQDGLVGDGFERVGRELQVHPIQLEQPPVLLDQRVPRLGEDADERLAVEVVHAGDDGQAADELGDHAELEQVLGHHLGERVGGGPVVLDPQLRPEPHPALADALLDDLLQAGERPAADEQHVGGVDLDELLVRVLAPALRGHRRGRALQDLQQRLLHALAGHVPGDRRVLALAGDLVDLIDVDDAGLGLLDVVLGGLDELEQDVLDVLADVAGLGQGGGVGDGERHVEQAGQRLGEQGLAGPGGPEQQDVGLGQLDPVLAGPDVAARLDPLVVVVDRDRQGLLGLFLADHVGVEELVDLARLGQAVPPELGGLGQLLLDDLVAEIYAFVADVHAGASDELLDLLLALSAERTLQEVTTVPDTCHQLTPLPRPPRRPATIGGPAIMGQPGPAGLPCTRYLTVPVAAPGAKLPNAGAAVTGSPAGSLRSGRAYLGPALEARQNLVHDAVLLGFLRREVLVPLDVPPHLLLGPAAVQGDDALHRGPHPQDLAGLDLQVARLAVAALSGGLVEQDARIRQRHPLVLGAGGEQHRRRRGRLADADGRDLRLDELHRVVDRHHRGDRSARRVDVHSDVPV